MDKLIENFSENGIEDFIDLVDQDENLIKKVTLTQFKKLLKKFISEYQKIKWNLANFFQLFMIIFKSKSEFQNIIMMQKDFVKTMHDFLTKKTKEEEQGVESKAIVYLLLEIFNYHNEDEETEIQNLVYLSKITEFMLEEINDDNDDEEEKATYGLGVVIFANVLGEEALKMIINHKNKSDFYSKFLHNFNDGPKNYIIDHLRFISLLINFPELCEQFLFYNDFLIVVDVFLREMENESELGKGSKFEEYAATMIDIIDSDAYISIYKKAEIEKIEKSIRSFMKNIYIEADDLDSCAAILETIDEVKSRLTGDIEKDFKDESDLSSDDEDELDAKAKGRLKKVSEKENQLFKKEQELSKKEQELLKIKLEVLKKKKKALLKK